MDSKASIRKQIRQQKKDLSEADQLLQSNKIFQELGQSDRFKSSTTVLAYWAMKDEVQTKEFIEKWFSKKVILLPVIKGDHLILKQFKGTSSLKENEDFNVLEPTGPTYRELNQIDIIIVPGIAFDEKNNRLGRGKGFYDRLLSKSKAYKIGIGFDFQLINEVPTEEHDIPLDLIITA